MKKMFQSEQAIVVAQSKEDAIDVCVRHWIGSNRTPTALELDQFQLRTEDWEELDFSQNLWASAEKTYKVRKSRNGAKFLMRENCSILPVDFS